jgi:hypothetical protein
MKIIISLILLLTIYACQSNQTMTQKYSDIPSYPNIKNIITSTNDNLYFSTSDKLFIVRNFYDTELKNKGWMRQDIDNDQEFEYDRIDRIENSIGYGRVMYIEIEECNNKEVCVNIQLFNRTETDQ